MVRLRGAAVPSKHNAQPWRFTVDDGAVELYADATRSLRVSDPDDRELTIGCGAALKTYAIAVRGLGYEPVVALLPDGPAGPLARVSEGGRRLPDPDEMLLLAAVPERRTDRGPLDASGLAAVTTARLQRAAEAEGALLQLLTAPGAQEALARIGTVAQEAANADAAYLSERRRVAAAAPYGARFAHPAYRRVLAAHPDRPLPAVVWTAGDGQADWLRAGMALQAVLLRATLEGVSVGFDSAPLEQPLTRVAVRREVGYAGFPQVVLRVGLGAGRPAGGKDRRPVAELLA